MARSSQHQDKPHLQVMGPIPFTQVIINDDFWAPRIQKVREHTLQHAYHRFEAVGHLEALRLTTPPETEPMPRIFWDSEVAKWIEAASYSLAVVPDPQLDQWLDDVIELIAQAQQPDGYMNSYFTAAAPEKRWTNLRDWHELYCAGHLIEAAVAHFEATGKRSLLDVVCRYVDYIAQIFGPGPEQIHGYDGHEEIELALIKLYRLTKEKRYLDLCRFFVDERGRQPYFFDMEARERGEDPQAFSQHTYEYNQSHLPVREQQHVVGHAVRAMYLNAALADLAIETDDADLLDVCRRLWDHLNATRLYVTGGIGASRENEGFTTDYDLPNETAYAETCAAIGLVNWCHLMLQLDCDRRYSDVMEHVLYNAVLSGIALDGERFFYENPLASTGSHHRQAWFDCACCPTNISRLLQSLGRYIYSANATEIAVHLFMQSKVQITLNGHPLTLRQTTNYPWDGSIIFQLEMDMPLTCGLNIRIPSWCQSFHLAINDEAVEVRETIQQGYACLHRQWHSGDRIILNLDMPIERIYAHPHIRQDVARVALQRGPLIYCLEEADHPVPPWQLIINTSAPIESQFVPDLLDGVVVLHGRGQYLHANDWNATLYRQHRPDYLPVTLTAIPYFAWDNRAPGAMNIWLHMVE